MCPDLPTEGTKSPVKRRLLDALKAESRLAADESN
jgi:hypothetical protein